MSARQRVVKARRNPYTSLVSAGIPPSEAATVLRIVEERLRGNLDDGVPFNELEMGLFATFDVSDIDAARADWYFSRAVPPWAKRLLDARE